MGRQLRTRLDCILPNLQDRMVTLQQNMKQKYDERAQDSHRSPRNACSCFVGGRSSGSRPFDPVAARKLCRTVRLEADRAADRRPSDPAPPGPGRSRHALRISPSGDLRRTGRRRDHGRGSARHAAGDADTLCRDRQDPAGPCRTGVNWLSCVDGGDTGEESCSSRLSRSSVTR